uniref:Cystatin domain-containing protein n=1 Tax=Brassica campestris TaxID=3711 RepID=M4CQA0_BRACM
MKSDDETAKLALTEEETRVEDEDDTSMEEESDSDNEGLWSVDEEDDDVERSPTINYSNMIEPEWDVDSYDGYECYDSDDRKSFSDDEEYEEFREFKFQAWKNKGLFDSSATMEGDDVSVKRASTEVESDSSVSKKPKIEDEDDTNMEDESDSDSTDSGRAWSVEAKDDDEEVVKPPNYLNMQDPEPEWDKDSYDGYELVFDSDGREGFPNDEEYQEFREYKTKAWKNRGFLEDPFRSIYPILDLEDLWSDRVKVSRRQYLANIASLCVKKLNEEKGSSVEVVSIVRSNLKAGGGFKLYITFMAREHPDGPLVEYQAKAMDFAGGIKPPFPILCIPASSMP